MVCCCLSRGQSPSVTSNWLMGKHKKNLVSKNRSGGSNIDISNDSTLSEAMNLPAPPSGRAQAPARLQVEREAWVGGAWALAL